MDNLQQTYYNKKIDTMNVLNISDAKTLLNGKKCIVVTGVTGQDGSYMVDYLLANTDYHILGCVRRLSVYNHKNIAHVDSPRFNLINFDLTDSHSICRIMELLKPDYFVNFAAQSFVASSWDFPEQTWQTNTNSVLHILEAVRLYNPTCRCYFAGSSEEFGNVMYTPQDENHPLRPRSPYGASKAAGRQIVKVWRESYGLYAVQCWLFNHESERRGEEFVTRKISKGVARIKYEIDNNIPVKPIELGNIDAKRDWSHALDFVDGVWRMLNQDKYAANRDKKQNPTDCQKNEVIADFDVNKDLKEYVLSSNETHVIREFVEKAFKAAGIENLLWEGEGLNEKLLYKDDNGKVHLLIVINPKFYRPAEVELLLGNSTAARKELGWEPKISFDELVKVMVLCDIDEIKGKKNT